MYNDEQNLYHYTYRKDGSESGQQNAGPAGDGAVGTVQSEPQRPIQEMKPVKKNRMGLKVTALALCCALLGGRIGRRHCVGSKSGNQRGHGPGQRPNRQPGIAENCRRKD